MSTIQTRQQNRTPWRLLGLGDLCYRDEDGYLWFLGRDDDVISPAGYRVGPVEVEDSLLKHPCENLQKIVPIIIRLIDIFLLVAARSHMIQRASKSRGREVALAETL